MARSAWVFDLIAADDEVRIRALRRHQSLLAGARLATASANRPWIDIGSPTPVPPYLQASMDQGWAAHERHRSQTILGPVSRYLSVNALVARWRYVEYAVLYLRWEADHPHDWDDPDSSLGSRWGTKDAILRRLELDQVPVSVLPQIRDLVLASLQRPYRCKDWRYARLVRHLAEPLLLDRIGVLLHAGDPLVRRRAQFVLDLAGRPERRIHRRTWDRWIATTQ